MSLGNPQQEHKTLYCNFCGKGEHEVTTLITDGNSHICNNCVMRCYELIAESAIDAQMKEGKDA